MNRTLLYTVQRVLEKLDLDPVDSINDSQDAILIAREAEDTFYDLVNRNEWPERYDIIKIESVGDVNNPTALKLPDNVLNVLSLRYNITESGGSNTEYRELDQLSPEDFLDKVYTRRTSDTAVQVASYKGIDIHIYNNKSPEYFTVFDNKYIVSDSFDNTVETTLQGAKTVARGSSVPVFNMTDTYIVPVDVTTYPLYLAELTSAASIALNGATDPENERRRNRGISRLRRTAYRTGTESNKNSFGRNGNGRS